MLQVASLQGGVPNPTSKNATDSKVVRSLVILIAEGANRVTRVNSVNVLDRGLGSGEEGVG
jgi:hypothetical protein